MGPPAGDRRRSKTAVAWRLRWLVGRPSRVAGRAGASCADIRVGRYAHPNCFSVIPSFQIFVMWRILSPSNSMT